MWWPRRFVVVFASGNNAPDTNGNLHTNFGLKAGGEYIALVRPNLTVASEFGPAGSNYPSQQTDISYGVHPVSESAAYFQTPTPGAANPLLPRPAKDLSAKSPAREAGEAADRSPGPARTGFPCCSHPRMDRIRTRRR